MTPKPMLRDNPRKRSLLRFRTANEKTKDSNNETQTYVNERNKMHKATPQVYLTREQKQQTTARGTRDNKQPQLPDGAANNNDSER